MPLTDSNGSLRFTSHSRGRRRSVPMYPEAPAAYLALPDLASRVSVPQLKQHLTVLEDCALNRDFSLTHRTLPSCHAVAATVTSAGRCYFLPVMF
ncbi:hypothetical protein JMJ77_0014339 [Colletotrichum scovillei]|uniref:Uncharacterized protein n=1 Tax=Colletotrichum scovillei TaxID=1209932 RepID=A0A9P7R3B2_9PEZI|nr:hypothetical protein JMJ77_0014339 [Colletotrichum scovillei]KAG7065869.1 hypothetical protein JMJ78_0012613 [Colletotrichum scovillei]KAG7068472.1 hypothetical protein JMJ76_0008159 [Colletotrichum scovillei]